MLQKVKHGGNTSPAANAAHIDYETEMILFIVESDSAAGKTATNEKYRTVVNLMIVSPHTPPYEKLKFYEQSSHLIEWIWINIISQIIDEKVIRWRQSGSVFS